MAPGYCAGVLKQQHRGGDGRWNQEMSMSWRDESEGQDSQSSQCQVKDRKRCTHIHTHRTQYLREDPNNTQMSSDQYIFM